MKKYHHHSCPNCGQYVGWKKIYLPRWCGARWQCPECGSLLKYDLKHRFWASCAMTVFLCASMNATESWLIRLILFLSAVIALVQFDGVKLADEDNKTCDDAPKTREERAENTE